MNDNSIGVRPISDQVFVRRDAPEGMYKGIVHLPDDRKEWPQLGTVLAVGPKVTCVQVGQRILFRNKAGSALEPDNRELDKRPEWERVVVLNSGDVNRGKSNRPSVVNNKDDGMGDILAIVEDEHAHA